MPFAKEQYLAQAVGYQNLVNEGNRVIDHWGEYKIFAKFAVTYFCKNNNRIPIIRPLAEREIIKLLKNNSLNKELHYDDFVVLINKWRE